MEQSTQTVIVTKAAKSMGIAIILAVLLGPLGLFYSTIIGGIVMAIVSLVVGFLTVGFGLLLTWPICVLWAAVAVGMHNKRIATA